MVVDREGLRRKKLSQKTCRVEAAVLGLREWGREKGGRIFILLVANLFAREVRFFIARKGRYEL